MKTIIFLLLLSTLSFAETYKMKQSVVDTKNHLQWQDMSINEEADKKWKLASSYCSSLKLFAENDWRLPSVDELKTMVAIQNSTKLFKFVGTDSYWSAEEDKNDSLNAMEAYSTNAYISSQDKCETSHFRCVRDYW